MTSTACSIRTILQFGAPLILPTFVKHGMRKHHLTLLACLLLSACATDDVSEQRGTNTTLKKRPDKVTAAVTPPAKARLSAPALTSPSMPIDGIVIQHSNRGKTNLLAAVGGGLDHVGADEYMTQQLESLRSALQNEIEQGEIRVEGRASDNAIRVSMTPANGFDNLSSVVKPGLLVSLNKIVPVLNQYGKTLLTVIGYIEQVGPDAGNLKLAERRAKSVTDYFVIQSVHALRVQSYARNDSQARGENSTGAGQPMRRVELWIQPVVAQ